MKRNFEFYNTITGWFVFLIALITYQLTLEPTVSFWDCGEFIASSFKLEVGHPPGAPFYMLLARFFSLFTFGKVEYVAYAINTLSSVASAFTILFLFWTITHFAKRIFHASFSKLSHNRVVAILGSGAVGALVYTFSDTFWFSAVEAEVYALSSTFTALVFWLMLKWEKEADTSNSNRWIVLIAYLMGLSIGVHLLNLLTIPALVFIYYFRCCKVTPKGILLYGVLGFAMLIFVQYIIIPGIPYLAAQSDLLFVNSFSLPFFSGVIVYLLVLLAILIGGIYYSIQQNLAWLNLLFTCLTVIILGYSSFTLIVIRSLANVPMDENNPENMFSLLSYLNREQYGDRPLLYGHYYNASVKETTVTKKVYSQLDGRYVPTDTRTENKYDDKYMTVFPRMYSRGSTHVSGYRLWGGDENDIKSPPSFVSNIAYFLNYQINHMYLRYFFWNFIGRQNDIPGHGGATKGNWMTGFSFIDNLMNLPEKGAPQWLVHNKGNNAYFFLPFLLGVLGIFFLSKTDKRSLLVLLLFFFFTGVAIILYLNQPPYQPRERDYAYAGSFYVWAIFIGLGVAGIYHGFIDRLAQKNNNIVYSFVIIMLFVPGLVMGQNWDDHDRSGRYTAREWARNYLISCAPNAILFTYGDNDTFPLWYLQEVEGCRTDVRVVNLSLLGTDWYIEQMQRKAYESDRLPMIMERKHYVQGRRDILPLFDRKESYTDVMDLMTFALQEGEEFKIETRSGEKYNYLPSKAFALPVHKQNAKNGGAILSKGNRGVADTLKWRVSKNYFMKNDLAILDILGSFNWQRPICFAISVGEGNMFGLSDYLRLDGFVYRLVPELMFQKEKDSGLTGWIDSDILYDNLMNNYNWVGMSDPDVFIDHQNRRTSKLIGIRTLFIRLAQQLLEEGKSEKAIRVVDKAITLMPHTKFPYGNEMLGFIQICYQAKAAKRGDAIAKKLWGIVEHDIVYYSQLAGYYEESVRFEKQESFAIVENTLALVEAFSREELVYEFDQRLEKLISKTE